MFTSFLSLRKEKEANNQCKKPMEEDLRGTNPEPPSLNLPHLLTLAQRKGKDIGCQWEKMGDKRRKRQLVQPSTLQLKGRGKRGWLEGWTFDYDLDGRPPTSLPSFPNPSLWPQGPLEGGLRPEMVGPCLFLTVPVFFSLYSLSYMSYLKCSFLVSLRWPVNKRQTSLAIGWRQERYEH